MWYSVLCARYSIGTGVQEHNSPDCTRGGICLLAWHRHTPFGMCALILVLTKTWARLSGTRGSNVVAGRIAFGDPTSPSHGDKIVSPLCEWGRGKKWVIPSKNGLHAILRFPSDVAAGTYFYLVLEPTETHPKLSDAKTSRKGILIPERPTRSLRTNGVLHTDSGVILYSCLRLRRTSFVTP